MELYDVYVALTGAYIGTYCVECLAGVERINDHIDLTVTDGDASQACKVCGAQAGTE